MGHAKIDSNKKKVVSSYGRMFCHCFRVWDVSPTKGNWRLYSHILDMGQMHKKISFPVLQKSELWHHGGVMPSWTDGFCLKSEERERKDGYDEEGVVDKNREDVGKDPWCQGVVVVHRRPQLSWARWDQWYQSPSSDKNPVPFLWVCIIFHLYHLGKTVMNINERYSQFCWG